MIPLGISQLLVVSGVSGSGKTFLMSRLRQNLNFAIAPSITTRNRRPDEFESEERIFCSFDTFCLLQERKSIIFCNNLFGSWYGYDLSSVNCHKIAIQLRLDYIEKFKIEYGSCKVVYIKPVDSAIAKSHIKSRATSSCEILERIAQLEYELENTGYCDRYVDVVFLNNFDNQSATDFVSIIESLFANAT